MEESTMANVDLVLDLAAPMPLVAADTDQMRQVIFGFITNAIEALGKAKGQVRISTGSMHCNKNYLSSTYLKEEMPEGMYAYVEVSDTGCGMDADTLSKVFDPFFSTKEEGQGTGGRSPASPHEEVGFPRAGFRDRCHERGGSGNRQPRSGLAFAC